VVVLALLSAFVVGIYDVSKKVSVQGNAVIPVLLTSVLFSSALMLPFFAYIAFAARVAFRKSVLCARCRF
jgi:hypothetical protein